MSMHHLQMISDDIDRNSKTFDPSESRIYRVEFYQMCDFKGSNYRMKKKLRKNIKKKCDQRKFQI